MRYLGIAFGSALLSLGVMAFRVRIGKVDEFLPNLFELFLWAAIALILSKTMRRPHLPRVTVRFRQIIIIVSMIFGTIITNVGFNLAQIKFFGNTYISSFEDPKPEPGSDVKPDVPTIPEKFMMNLVPVVSEEILFRWIILGALMMALSPIQALVISSLIFGLSHVPVKTMVGYEWVVGLSAVLPTFAIGVFCGIAFIRYGLGAAIAIHFFVNLVGWFAYNQIYIADTVIWGSAAVAFFVLPITLWLTRKRSVLGQPAVQ